MLRITPLFTILKSPYSTGQPARLEKITSVQEQGRLAQRDQASKAPTGLSSNRSDDEDYKDPLGSNKRGSSKAPTEASAGPS